MRRIICLVLSITICISIGSVATITSSASGDFSKTAMEFVKNIKVGWNLGNTFESCDARKNNGEIWSVGNVTPNQQETAWWNVATTQEMIDRVASKGFNAMRLPVSWYYQMVYNSSTGEYELKADFEKRIKEVIGYAQKNNMYVIMNMHHDDRVWLNINDTGDTFEKEKQQYASYWKAIATAFKDYDEKLIFEGLNEPISIDGANQDWYCHDFTAIDRLNELYKIFVGIVRATGGNNDKRYLVVPTYGAQRDMRIVSRVVVPNDDHLILDVHWYTTSASEEEVAGVAQNIYNFAAKNNIGFVIGECGVLRQDQDSVSLMWPSTYIRIMRKYQVPCFIWDDGGDYTVMERENGIYWISDDFSDNVVRYGGAFFKGDVNGDGKISVSDEKFLRWYLAKYKSNYCYVNPVSADIDGDGVFSAKDMLKMKKYLANIITTL